MMKTTILLSSCAVLALSSCKNPADKTTKATVQEAAAKVTTSTEGGTAYTFTPTSTLSFVGSKITGSHQGGFKTFTGHFTLKDGVPVGNDHVVKIDMNSTFSDNEKLTGHLKSPDFFDVEKFPESKFEVTEVAVDAKDSKNYLITGNLSLHGVTKSISFPATVSSAGSNYKIQAEFNINRKDFAINYPGKVDDLIRDEVVIKFDLEAQPKK